MAIQKRTRKYYTCMKLIFHLIPLVELNWNTNTLIIHQETIIDNSYSIIL